MIQKIIPKFPESERAGLIQAANVWRLPYWDFAAKKLRKGSKVADYDLPLIAVPKTITVLRPDGKTSTIPNPMRAFKIEASMADPMKQNNLEPGKQDPKLKALGLTGGLRPVGDLVRGLLSALLTANISSIILCPLADKFLGRQSPRL